MDFNNSDTQCVCEYVCECVCVWLLSESLSQVQQHPTAVNVSTSAVRWCVLSLLEQCIRVNQTEAGFILLIISHSYNKTCTVQTLSLQLSGVNN